MKKPRLGPGRKSLDWRGALLVAVVADGLDRTAFEGLHAQADFLFGSRLLVDEGVAALVMPSEETGGGFAAEIAINALLIDKEFAADVFRPFVCFVSHTQREKESIATECQAAFHITCDITAGSRPPSAPENVACRLVFRIEGRSFAGMLSDRPYMRDNYGAYHRQGVSILTWILSVTIAGFILQNVFLHWFNAGPLFASALALNISGIESGKIWTLLTYGLLHRTDNLLHIVGNLLAIYFLGRELLPIMGERRLVRFYAGAVLLGGLVWCATHWATGGILIGASAATCGLLIVFACFFPHRQITFLLFFILPVTLKPKYLALAVLGLDLCGFAFYEIMGAASPFGIAHSAHLGGMAAGWIYFRYLHESSWRLPWRKTAVEPPGWVQKKAPTSTPAPAFSLNLSNRDDLRVEVDRILDKINSQGFGALTTGEKKILDDAKDLLSRR